MAGYISQETIDSVINYTDIISVVGEFTKLERKSGNDWWGRCPFHNEKTGSFHVDGDKKFYHCFGCSASGNAIKFVMEMEKVSYADAIKNLAKKAGIQVKYNEGYAPAEKKEDTRIPEYIELYERTASMFHYFLMESEMGKSALKYIMDRGLDMETLKKFKLGYAPADRKWLKKFLLGKNFSNDFLNESGLFSKNYPDISLYNDRLMFPIFNNDGKVVAFGGRILHPQGPDDRKYLNSPELIHYKKREILYAFNFAKNEIRKQKKVIVCEGYMDCIAYHQSGIGYAVASLGTALTEQQIKLLHRFADTIILSYDSDNAGQMATQRNILLCRQQDFPAKVVQLKGGKDPSEILNNLGKENLTAQVNGAIFDSDFLLNMLGQKYPIDKPEGKLKASLEFFDYVDVLQHDIEKEACLEQLCQAYNLRPENVKRDFVNRAQAKGRIAERQSETPQQVNPLVMNAELRGVIAVAADVNQFKILRSYLTENDLQNPDARVLYKILEGCYTNGNYSIPEILARCENPQLQSAITNALSTGVYKEEQLETIVQDTIKLVQKNKIDLRRNELIVAIREFVVANEEDQKKLNQLLTEKMELDKQVQSLKNN